MKMENFVIKLHLCIILVTGSQCVVDHHFKDVFSFKEIRLLIRDHTVPILKMLVRQDRCKGSKSA